MINVDGHYIVRLLTNGRWYADRTLNCGPRTFKAAIEQWEKKGFEVLILEEPK